MHDLTERFERNKKWIYFSLIAAFLWGLAAHGYLFLNSNFTHDSMTEFNGAVFGNQIKLASGRFLVPVYRAIFRTSITLPWLIGILSMLWIGLAVFLTAKTFRAESKVSVFLIAGIFTANLTVSATAATYLHDLDCNMFALLCSVAAVFCWRELRRGWLYGAVLVAMSLSIYQSYITVSVVLAMFACIMMLLDGGRFRQVFSDGLKAIGMLLLGGILYYIALYAVQAITGVAISSGTSNSMDQALGLTPELLKYVVVEAYQKWYTRLVNAISPYPTVTKGAADLLLILSGGMLLLSLLRRQVRLPEKLLCLCLVVLLPLAMNLMHVLTIGNAHELMLYAFWLTYLLAILLGEHLSQWLKNVDFSTLFRKKRNIAPWPRALCLVLVSFLLYSNVQTANAMYLKKDLETDAYFSLMTRVLYRMEDYDEYVPGSTPVVFIGTSDQLNEVIPGFEGYRDPVGMYYTDVLIFMDRDQCQAYFKYILNNPINLAETAVWRKIAADPKVAQMPCYPSDGFLEIIDEVLVVKLG